MWLGSRVYKQGRNSLYTVMLLEASQRLYSVTERVYTEVSEISTLQVWLYNFRTHLVTSCLSRLLTNSRTTHTHTHTHTHTRTHMHICTHTQFIGLPFRVAIGKETLQKDEHVKRNTTCSVRHSNVQGVISASETSLGVHSGRYKP